MRRFEQFVPEHQQQQTIAPPPQQQQQQQTQIHVYDTIPVPDESAQGTKVEVYDTIPVGKRTPPEDDDVVYANLNDLDSDEEHVGVQRRSEQVVCTLSPPSLPVVLSDADHFAPSIRC
jgi:hypothetical protein